MQTPPRGRGGGVAVFLKPVKTVITLRSSPLGTFRRRDSLPRNVSSGGERRDAGGKMSLAGRVRERRRPYLKATGELHGHSIAHELLIRKTFFLRSPFGYGGLNLC